MEETKKRNYWKVIALVLLTIVIIFSILIVVNIKLQTAYSNGFQDGAVQVVKGITESGDIPYFETIQGNLTLKTTTITELCGGAK
jgi:uncharacterized membrane protein YhaH (DUF805 family)